MKFGRRLLNYLANQTRPQSQQLLRAAMPQLTPRGSVEASSPLVMEN